MDIKTLEEEYKALLSDKAGEFGYLQSLKEQIEKVQVKVLVSFYFYLFLFAVSQKLGNCLKDHLVT